ncbi:MAG TPA: hypothetical protein VHZ54_02490 [Solirubrobacterales bacterium]|nr:hypothetical protein [Solirubrobacterales bacterium]
MALAAVFGVWGTSAASAARSARWAVSSFSEPTDLTPGDTGDQLVLTAVVDGEGTAEGAATPITITDTVPSPGLTIAPAGVRGARGGFPSGSAMSCQTTPTVSCTTTESVGPGEALKMIVSVDVAADAAGTLENQVSISGGGVAAAAAVSTIAVGSAPAAAGIVPGSLLIARSTDQAGAHPTLGVGFVLSTDAVGSPVGATRKIGLDLPPGLLADADAFPRCSPAEVEATTCSAAAELGRAFVSVPITGGGPTAEDLTLPIYDLTPEVGELAALAFAIPGLPPVRLDLGIAPLGGYHLRAVISAGGEPLPLSAADLTFWGTPADVSGSGTPQALITNPTSCGGEPSATLVSPESGAPVEAWSGPTEGCSALPFEPTLKVSPEVSAADSPSGLSAEIDLPQSQEPEGLATAQLQKAVVSLPPELVLDPAIANGLEACSLAQVGMSAAGVPDGEPVGCPGPSKLGDVEVDSPLVDRPLTGAIYLARQGENPFGSLFAVYFVIEDPLTGTLVKLAGRVDPDPQSGRLTASFEPSPQLPFEEVKLHFSDAGRPPFTTPLTCGTKALASDLTPWSSPEGADADPGASFQIGQGAGGSGCVGAEAQAPDAPAFAAGTVSSQSDTYTPFVLRLRREDGSQRFRSLDLTSPEGLIGKLAGIPYCSDAEIAAAAAATGTQEARDASCPAASAIGTITVASGAGPTPFVAQGTAYLAGPYEGAPISIVTLTPALAGPFDLGTAVDRVATFIDKETSQVHAVTETIPGILDGVPLDVREITIDLDRPGFMRTPTKCSPLAFSGSVGSPAGSTAPLSAAFQVEGCRRLAFKPRISVRLKGGTTRDKDPALRVSLSWPKGAHANLAKITVGFPHSEFVEQSHIKTICTRVQFAEGGGDGEECPKESIYGHAEVRTPLLAKPLSGPVFQRSSDHTLPDLAIALRGQIDLAEDGVISSDARGGIRSSFAVVPDADFSSFKLQMYGGKKGLFVNSENLCRKPQRADVRMVGQNGKVLVVHPLIANDCGKHRKDVRRKPRTPGRHDTSRR